MRAVFIGAGNVATHLATELYKLGSNIAQVYSRTVESAKNLAEKTNASYTTEINTIITDADIYIFSVKDSVLQELVSQLPHNNGIWVHTAGSMPLDVFKDHTANYGVIYPLQTFSKNRDLNWKNIPIFVEASDDRSLNKLKNIANQLSDHVIELSSDKRKYVHLTGVFACNFTNFMYTLSAEMLKKADLPFNTILPLIDETCSKVHDLSPIEAQTGPAIRFDENVINNHLELIEDEETKELYRLISKKIYETHKAKQP